MGEFNREKEVIKEIAKLRNEYQIIDYIESNIPKELLDDEEFVIKMKKANPFVKIALEMMYEEKDIDNIKSEIEEYGLENVIENDEKLESIPKEYKEELFEIARKYEEDEEYDKAKRLYNRMVEYGATQVDKFNERAGREKQKRETIYYMSKYAYYKCKIQNNEPLTDEDREELENLAKEDKENILGLETPGKMSDFQIFESLFDDITEERLVNEILPQISRPKTGGTGHKDPTDEPGFIEPDEDGIEPDRDDPREYSDELLPEKRFIFIKENFDIESFKIGKGKFAGNIIFKIKDSDVVIVERFFKTIGRGAKKEIVPADSTATYIVHKDAKIDLENSERSKLVERKKQEKEKEDNGDSPKLITSVNHRGNYYKRLLARFKVIEDNGKKLSTVSNELEEGIIERTNEDFEEERIKSDNQEDNEILKTVNEDDGIYEKDDELDYDIGTLINEIEKLDYEYENIKDQITKIDLEISEIATNIIKYKESINENISESLAKENIKKIITSQLELLNDCKNKRKELETLKEKLKLLVKKNRDKRNELKNRLTEKIKGEE